MKKPLDIRKVRNLKGFTCNGCYYNGEHLCRNLREDNNCYDGYIYQVFREDDKRILKRDRGENGKV